MRTLVMALALFVVEVKNSTGISSGFFSCFPYYSLFRAGMQAFFS
jgi:hypothetical protein